MPYNEARETFFEGEDMTVDEIKAKLADRRLYMVARAAGVEPSTLYRLMKGKCKPNTRTMRVLTAYLNTKG